MKHWTEPNGIFLIQIPIDWQYLNSGLSDYEEKSPYGFQPYEDPIGCFQISCYPLSELAPSIAIANPNGVRNLSWKASREDNSEFCTHLFFGAYYDQALIGKYIYDAGLEGDKRIAKQLGIAIEILNSVVIVPERDRKLAADLDKFDRFTGALAASHDLLYAAIDAGACIEIIAIAANQIDAYLRLSLVIATQLKKKTNDIETRYLFQADGEKGIMERKVFEDALKLKVIDLEAFNGLNELYSLRNRVIHRYIISDIKSRDLVEIAGKYLSALERTRLTLRDFEQKQAVVPYGVYGTKFGKTLVTDDAIRRLHASANDKHLLEKYKRSVSDRRS
ncbi:MULTISPECIES: hypothetical protein [Pseudomonas]|uniref:hypothetical protein n=1 Tax=Pseudomonas TaxID=286 RepID=UPI00053B12E7|nr:MULTISPECIES: hypothetical protein [Pseudomonas]KSF16505.1 hypothetical protein AO923_08050 [Pseudomonas aeruginosa]KSH35514.1 hypothetical protein AO965_02870 [Pseudomonas aeruginosa]KXD38452.1 hypothetical protein AW904_06905 [Pseudomonas aeruginosa]KXD40513.1 hypothetical protein AW905_07590 [Pseudomonas aeruginosa]KXD41146.1 hypothetical protein AW906_07600 [Pseudomonas aeruginosa]